MFDSTIPGFCTVESSAFAERLVRFPEIFSSARQQDGGEVSVAMDTGYVSCMRDCATEGTDYNICKKECSPPVGHGGWPQPTTLCSLQDQLHPIEESLLDAAILGLKSIGFLNEKDQCVGLCTLSQSPGVGALSTIPVIGPVIAAIAGADQAILCGCKCTKYFSQ